MMLLASLSSLCFAQSKRLIIRGHTLLAREFKVKSEEDGPGTHDILLKLYRMKKGKPEYLCQHYLYKNEGGDCNNLFWDIGTYKISGDTIRFISRHCQKTGFDPITEWEQKIYTIDAKGKLILVGEQYKKEGSETWSSY